jgi:hypothetical protein
LAGTGVLASGRPDLGPGDHDPAQLEAWYDDGRPTAWAMLDGRGHVSAQCDRSLDSAGDLAAAVVGWAAASPAGLLAATVDAGETGLRAALARAA